MYLTPYTNVHTSTSQTHLPPHTSTSETHTYLTRTSHTTQIYPPPMHLHLTGTPLRPYTHPSVSHTPSPTFIPQRPTYTSHSSHPSLTYTHVIPHTHTHIHTPHIPDLTYHTHPYPFDTHVPHTHPTHMQETLCLPCQVQQLRSMNKLIKDRLTGETVYYVCVQRPSRTNSEDPKKQLDPRVYISF